MHRTRVGVPTGHGQPPLHQERGLLIRRGQRQHQRPAQPKACNSDVKGQQARTCMCTHPGGSSPWLPSNVKGQQAHMHVMCTCVCAHPGGSSSQLQSTLLSNTVQHTGVALLLVACCAEVDVGVGQLGECNVVHGLPKGVALVLD